MSDALTPALALTQFGNPSTSEPVIQALRASWHDRQWEDLVATLTLLGRLDGWQPWCETVTMALDDLTTNARVRMLSDPSFVSWQQMLEAQLWPEEGVAGPTLARAFRRDDLHLFALCAAVPDRHGGHLASIRPQVVTSLSGLGYAVITGNSSVECRRDGQRIFIEDIELPPSDRRSLWEGICFGPDWRVEATPLYKNALEIGARSPYLTTPFLQQGCEFNCNFNRAGKLIDTIRYALDTLKATWLDLWWEIMSVDRCLVLFQETRFPNTVSSFSNSSVPGALFVCPFVDGELIQLGDLLDSIVHEHAHQKLYTLESVVSLYDKTYAAKHRSPWKNEPRPVGGILHGYFVFSLLSALWTRIMDYGDHVLSPFAANRVASIARELDDARATLSQYCPFTEAGAELFDSLAAEHIQS